MEGESILFYSKSVAPDMQTDGLQRHALFFFSERKYILFYSILFLSILFYSVASYDAVNDARNDAMMTQ